MKKLKSIFGGLLALVGIVWTFFILFRKVKKEDKSAELQILNKKESDLKQEINYLKEKRQNLKVEDKTLQEEVDYWSKQ